MVSTPAQEVTNPAQVAAADDTADGFQHVKRRRPHKAARAAKNQADAAPKKRHQPEDRTATPNDPKKSRVRDEKRKKPAQSYASVAKGRPNYYHVLIRASEGTLSDAQVAEVDRLVDDFLFDQDTDELRVEKVDKRRGCLYLSVKSQETQEALINHLSSLSWGDLPTLFVGDPPPPLKLRRCRAYFSGTRGAEDLRVKLVHRYKELPEEGLRFFKSELWPNGEGKTFLVGLSAEWLEFLQERHFTAYLGSRKLVFRPLGKRRRDAEAASGEAVTAVQS